MDTGWLDKYLDAWVKHPLAGGPDGSEALKQLVSLMTEDVRYEDVPSHLVWEGHHGVARMCKGAFHLASDLTIDIVSRVTDGRMFAFESLGTGTNTGAVGSTAATDLPIEIRALSIGSVSSDGLVESHRDYWNIGDLLAQVGAMPAPELTG
jgi:hypothetical protein